jgi:hypothetical protein
MEKNKCKKYCIIVKELNFAKHHKKNVKTFSEHHILYDMNICILVNLIHREIKK